MESDDVIVSYRDIVLPSFDKVDQISVVHSSIIDLWPKGGKKNDLKVKYEITGNLINEIITTSCGLLCGIENSTWDVVVRLQSEKKPRDEFISAAGIIQNLLTSYMSNSKGSYQNWMLSPGLPGGISNICVTIIIKKATGMSAISDVDVIHKKCIELLPLNCDFNTLVLVWCRATEIKLTCAELEKLSSSDEVRQIIKNVKMINIPNRNHCWKNQFFLDEIFRLTITECPASGLHAILCGEENVLLSQDYLIERPRLLFKKGLIRNRTHVSWFQIFSNFPPHYCIPEKVQLKLVKAVSDDDNNSETSPTEEHFMKILELLSKCYESFFEHNADKFRPDIIFDSTENRTGYKFFTNKLLLKCGCKIENKVFLDVLKLIRRQQLCVYCFSDLIDLICELEIVKRLLRPNSLLNKDVFSNQLEIPCSNTEIFQLLEKNSINGKATCNLSSYFKIKISLNSVPTLVWLSTARLSNMVSNGGVCFIEAMTMANSVLNNFDDDEIKNGIFSSLRRICCFTDIKKVTTPEQVSVIGEVLLSISNLKNLLYEKESSISLWSCLKEISNPSHPLSIIECWNILKKNLISVVIEKGLHLNINSVLERPKFNQVLFIYSEICYADNLFSKVSRGGAVTPELWKQYTNISYFNRKEMGIVKYPEFTSAIYNLSKMVSVKYPVGDYSDGIRLYHSGQLKGIGLLSNSEFFDYSEPHVREIQIAINSNSMMSLDGKHKWKIIHKEGSTVSEIQSVLDEIGGQSTKRVMKLVIPISSMPQTIDQLIRVIGFSKMLNNNSLVLKYASHHPSVLGLSKGFNDDYLTSICNVISDEINTSNSVSLNNCNTPEEKWFLLCRLLLTSYAENDFHGCHSQMETIFKSVDKKQFDIYTMSSRWLGMVYDVELFYSILVKVMMDCYGFSTREIEPKEIPTDIGQKQFFKNKKISKSTRSVKRSTISMPTPPTETMPSLTPIVGRGASFLIRISYLELCWHLQPSSVIESPLLWIDPLTLIPSLEEVELSISLFRKVQQNYQTYFNEINCLGGMFDVVCISKFIATTFGSDETEASVFFNDKRTGLTQTDYLLYRSWIDLVSFVFDLIDVTHVGELSSTVLCRYLLDHQLGEIISNFGSVSDKPTCHYQIPFLDHHLPGFLTKSDFSLFLTTVAFKNGNPLLEEQP